MWKTKDDVRNSILIRIFPSPFRYLIVMQCMKSHEVACVSPNNWLWIGRALNVTHTRTLRTAVSMKKKKNSRVFIFPHFIFNSSPFIQIQSFLSWSYTHMQWKEGEHGCRIFFSSISLYLHTHTHTHISYMTYEEQTWYFCLWYAHSSVIRLLFHLRTNSFHYVLPKIFGDISSIHMEKLTGPTDQIRTNVRWWATWRIDWSVNLNKEIEWIENFT